MIKNKNPEITLWVSNLRFFVSPAKNQAIIANATFAANNTNFQDSTLIIYYKYYCLQLNFQYFFITIGDFLARVYILRHKLKENMDKKEKKFEIRLTEREILKYIHIFDKQKQAWLEIPHWKRQIFLNDLISNFINVSLYKDVYEKWTINLGWILIFQFLIHYQFPTIWTILTGSILILYSITHLCVGQGIKSIQTSFAAAYCLAQKCFEENP